MRAPLESTLMSPRVGTARWRIVRDIRAIADDTAPGTLAIFRVQLRGGTERILAGDPSTFRQLADDLEAEWTS